MDFKLSRVSYSFNKLSEKRNVLNSISVFLSLVILFPLIGLFTEGLEGLRSGTLTLGADELSQINGTFILLACSSILGGGIGTANGWLLSNCRFNGRKALRLAQLIPLATPAYLLAATLIDLGSINGIRVHGMFWGVIIMASTTYPYVFLLSAESFSKGGRRQLEASRSLGVGAWQSFYRIALPIAIPSIGAGIALMAMETINELGAVQLLNIPSISAGIVENWVEENDPSGAIALALIALLIVMALVVYERILRRKSRRWTEGINGGESPAWELKGIRSLLAQGITLIPPLFTLGTPLLWSIINIEQIQKGWDSELISLTIRSFALGLSAAIITTFFALMISISKRWQSNNSLKALIFLSGIGYAIPGSVIALSLLSFSGYLNIINALILLSWGYCIRFLAVSKGGLDAAYERISPSIDEAATGLGCKWPQLLRKVHFPLLKGPLGVGLLLVFVDTIKELPLTFILRPFDFDTLSVRIFQYAGDERMAESLLPALIILLLGLAASIALIPKIADQKNQ